MISSRRMKRKVSHSFATNFCRSLATKGSPRLSQLRVDYVPRGTSTKERATLQCQWSYLLGSRGGSGSGLGSKCVSNHVPNLTRPMVLPFKIWSGGGKGLLMCLIILQTWQCRWFYLLGFWGGGVYVTNDEKNSVTRSPRSTGSQVVWVGLNLYRRPMGSPNSFIVSSKFKHVSIETHGQMDRNYLGANYPRILRILSGLYPWL